MNLADPELELIDPTPNVHTLFIHFDKEFFWTKLASRAVVRWSKRMYSCAGICSYEGRGGLCDIALSEPLLKLRPRKDLVETLLHEMIHAFLFVTNRDQDRDGHGPNFQSHMHRINKIAGLNISIYHSFHDEVHLYQTHWWRCDGPCQSLRPYFGIVRRTNNRAPGPTDYWWSSHQKKCGGNFIKIKEPENFKARQKNTAKSNNAETNKKNNTKSSGDITKYINNNNNIKTINSIPNSNTAGKSILKDSNINNSNLKTKSNSSSTLVVGKKGVIFNPTAGKPKTEVPLFTGNGHTLADKPISDHRSVTEQVRNIWANKELPSVVNKDPVKKLDTSVLGKKPKIAAGTSNPNKQKASDTNIQSPPAKIKKIDDYFKASSVLKDLYGDDFKLTQINNCTKLVAVKINQELVDCPTCNAKIDNSKINEHLDECLNRDIIKELSQDNSIDIPMNKPGVSNIHSNNNVVNKVENIPIVKPKATIVSKAINVVDLTNNNIDHKIINKGRRKSVPNISEDFKSEFNNKNPKIRKSESFVTKDRGDEITGLVQSKVKIEPSNIQPVKSKPPIIKIEPGASSSKDSGINEQACPCCGTKFDKTVEEHLEECLIFTQDAMSEDFGNTSVNDISTIVINDDDFDDNFDESQELNATGTKTPCPCCMKMVEEIAMNDHLDLCLGITES